MSALAASGEGAVPTPLLTPALVLAVAWAIWDAHGRLDLSPWLPRLPGRRSAASRPAQAPRAPRNPAAAPLPDERIRAARAANRHVRAALHGAGTRG